jgi:drug/metabolite transporter (DMT)-like permease
VGLSACAGRLETVPDCSANRNPIHRREPDGDAVPGGIAQAWLQSLRTPCKRSDFWQNSGHLLKAEDTALASTPPPRPPHPWLFSQPYLLLSLTSLFWAGNAIIGRSAAGHIPPVTLAFVRWGVAFLIVLPLAWRHLVRDWSTIRKHLGLMIVISVIGIGAFNTLQYWSLEYTTALNVLLLQSAGPLFVAVWSLVVIGVRLTVAQAGGIAVSLIGVLVILLHGDLTALATIELNKGDLIFTFALAIFGLYAVLAQKRPAMHNLSFAAFTFGAGALCLVPLLGWELLTRPVMQLDVPNVLSLAYVVVFPSTLAYLCYNRGVELIGANRAAPFFHLVPLFGSVMAIVFLGERLQMFHVVGYALVLTGVFIAARKPGAASPESTAA